MFWPASRRTWHCAAFSPSRGGGAFARDGAAELSRWGTPPSASACRRAGNGGEPAREVREAAAVPAHRRVKIPRALARERDMLENEERNRFEGVQHHLEMPIAMTSGREAPHRPTRSATASAASSSPKRARSSRRPSASLSRKPRSVSSWRAQIAVSAGRILMSLFIVSILTTDRGGMPRLETSPSSAAGRRTPAAWTEAWDYAAVRDRDAGG